MELQFNEYILFSLLFSSLYFDLTKKKIPNFLTFPVMLWGLFSNTVTGRFEGFLFSSYGLLLGIGLFIIPFVMGGMGGGDVKLLGAIGAMKGAQFVFHAALFTVLCGGGLAIVFLIANGQLLSFLKKILAIVAVPLLNVLYLKFGFSFLNRLSLFFSPSEKKQEEKKLFLPYGVAIVLGTLIVLSNLGGQILPLSTVFYTFGCEKYCSISFPFLKQTKKDSHW